MKVLNLLQLVFEILVAVGFAVGLFPFGYLLTLWWVIPLTVVNLVFSILSMNRTLTYTITNVVMAVLALIPIIGYGARVVGIVMSTMSAMRLGKRI